MTLTAIIFFACWVLQAGVCVLFYLANRRLIATSKTLVATSQDLIDQNQTLTELSSELSERLANSTRRNIELTGELAGRNGG